MIGGSELDLERSSHHQTAWSSALLRFLRPDLASREELQQRLAAKVAALRTARHAEERKKQTEAAKRFRATNGHVEKKARLLLCVVLCTSAVQNLQVHAGHHAQQGERGVPRGRAAAESSLSCCY